MLLDIELSRTVTAFMWLPFFVAMEKLSESAPIPIRRIRDFFELILMVPMQHTCTQRWMSCAFQSRETSSR